MEAVAAATAAAAQAQAAATAAVPPAQAAAMEAVAAATAAATARDISYKDRKHEARRPKRSKASIFNFFNQGKEFSKFKKMTKIKGTTKICDIYRFHPKAIDYLIELGICECKGMGTLTNTVEREVKKRDMDLEEVLLELNKRA
jgi:hypothetical protein